MNKSYCRQSMQFVVFFPVYLFPARPNWLLRERISMNLLKKRYYVLLGCFIVILLGNNTMADSESKPLLLLTDSVKGVDGSIEEWTLHTRERLTEKPDEAANRLHASLTGWQESAFNKGNTDGYIFEHTQGSVQQKIEIVSSDTAGGVAYMLYSVTAADEEEIRAFFSKEFAATYSQIFHGKPRVFTCIKGKFDGTLEEVLSNQLSTLLSGWKAEKREAVSEKNFYSLSMYSERFGSDLPLSKREMNVQVGLRKKQRGSETNFVIGTPLITIEY
ncbi:YwmB family TATA-box binding protein [Bacillus badius]|uniref:YwmB family TATA-box binding protein n=1 Tax=Bacillus badius TaxID=1455 RepID=UPI0009E612CC|nr:YwmB family TATA-box binding protein [Bacillus badius]